MDLGSSSNGISACLHHSITHVVYICAMHTAGGRVCAREDACVSVCVSHVTSVCYVAMTLVNNNLHSFDSLPMTASTLIEISCYLDIC